MGNIHAVFRKYGRQFPPHETAERALVTVIRIGCFGIKDETMGSRLSAHSDTPHSQHHNA